MLIISPFHHIPNIQQSNTVTVSTGQLSDLHLLLPVLSSEGEIGERLYFGDVTNVPDLANAQLTLQIAAECVNLV